MLVIKLSDLTEDEMNMLADIAVCFQSKTILDTLEKCITFTWQCVEKANEDATKEAILNRLLGDDNAD